MIRPAGTTGIEMYPCDRGNPNTTARGYHHFQASAHGVVCVYCGKRTADDEVRVTHRIA